MLAVAEVLVAKQPDRGVRGHEPALLLDDGALQRGLLPILADHLFEVVGVENPAHDVLGAWLLALLDEGDLEPGLGHRGRGGGAGGARSDDDRVQLFLFGHHGES